MPLMDVAVREVDALGLDPEKFPAFYEEALPRIYGYFLHRCGGSVPVAEDLTQETFLASVAELKNGRRPETPISWIYGIARHKLLDHYRKQARAEQPLADVELTLEENAFTCHRRVHHGADGDAYNDDLKLRLSTLET